MPAASVANVVDVGHENEYIAQTIMWKTTNNHIFFSSLLSKPLNTDNNCKVIKKKSKFTFGRCWADR